MVDLSSASWCGDFLGTPPGSKKAPLKIKNLKNRGWKVGERTPYILAYEKNLILVLIWEGFGKPLGVAWGSKNLKFSCEGCSKSDFGLDE